MSSEPWPANIFWALGCCLCGTPVCAAWAVSRLQPWQDTGAAGGGLALAGGSRKDQRREGIFMPHDVSANISDLDQPAHTVEVSNP
eukprot:SAG22_NODE_21403_length_257_cov_0.734177_1_plen_85_part_11